jgi:hypothetical protein
VEEIVVTSIFLQTVVLMVPSTITMFAARSTALFLPRTTGSLHWCTQGQLLRQLHLVTKLKPNPKIFNVQEIYKKFFVFSEFSTYGFRQIVYYRKQDKVSVKVKLISVRKHHPMKT